MDNDNNKDPCTSCGKTTGRKVKSYETGYQWVFECEDCDCNNAPVVTEGFGDI